MRLWKEKFQLLWKVIVIKKMWQTIIIFLKHLDIGILKKERRLLKHLYIPAYINLHVTEKNRLVQGNPAINPRKK